MAEIDKALREHASYVEYNKTLRAWFVAYGIGAPLIALTQEHLFKALAASPRARTIAYLFLAGVAMQILVALLNKWSNWYRYDLNLHDTVLKRPPSRSVRMLARLARFLRRHRGIDLSVDLLTVALFASTTVIALETLFSSH